MSTFDDTGREPSRNADKTRNSLLEAGAYWFARKTYDQVSVREIADRACVAPALINRYFGSKALLYSELLIEAAEAGGPMTGDVASLGLRLAALMQACPNGAYAMPGGTQLMILLQAVASVGLQGIVVEHIRHLATKQLVVLLEGAERDARAGLIVGYLTGCLVISRMTPLTVSTGQCLADAIQACVDARP
ncbi:TetR/AcrR family transcriptional regulator [Lichenicoccus roseus]|uniref:TetR/AcrR family transcriptional regulator n=1 Tax=Lichenicoccus roseus TaxID=2683649 RepID=A0A5R9J152_9PROT|nr:TetR/AcrR family transcriptional regulator [Lichenicoccus roseus]TLU70573.1 TetR/AcrR family transcriptional regulator [Lichenicoccus roseus]